jgi:hypothetical protein
MAGLAEVFYLDGADNHVSVKRGQIVEDKTDSISLKQLDGSLLIIYKTRIVRIEMRNHD